MRSFQATKSCQLTHVQSKNKCFWAISVQNISKSSYFRQKSVSKTTDFYKEEFNKMSLKGMFNLIKFWSWWISRQDIVSRTWETLSALNRLCSRFWHILHVTLLISLTHFTRKIFQVKSSFLYIRNYDFLWVLICL